MERYDLKKALEELPIFPLPRLVFFPNTMLPLHVFESRYRKMLADCLETHGAMAVVRLEPRSGNREPIARVAGAGIVVHHEAFPDGRLNVVLAGSARVELEELPFVPPYRRARAKVLEPVHTRVSDEDHAALVAAATEFVREVRRQDSDFSFDLPPQSRGPGVLADVCAAHLVVDADVRQRLLEELDDAARVRTVIEELASQRLSLGDRSRVLH